ncbi:MAG: glycosyltransferase family 1 protein [Candidatus Saccharibacteria bacterium]
MKQTQKHIVIDARIRRSSTGRYIDRLLEHLQKTDTVHRYSVLIQPDDPWQPAASNFTAVKTKYGQFSLNPLNEFGFTRQLYALNADIVHYTTNAQPLFYFRPTITTTMDLTMLRFTRAGKTPLPIFWLKMAAYRTMFWLGNKKSKAIIAISNFTRDDLIKNYPFTKNKITVTYCASEPPIRENAKKPTYLGNGEPFLLYVGAAFPHKNLPFLVDSLPEIVGQPDLKLVLAGKKEYYYRKLDEYIGKKSYSNRIITPGFVSDAELKWLYENCSAYVFPSLSEGFGLPGLEAMVHGCPVVSSNATCLPEVYGDAAHYFDPKNVDDMTNKISSVLTDKKLRDELISKGYKQAAKYSWQKMAQQTLDVYNEVLKT